MSERKEIKNLRRKPPKHERKLEVKRRIEEMLREFDEDDRELAASLDDVGILYVARA